MRLGNYKMENAMRWDNYYLVVSNAIARCNMIAKNGFLPDSGCSQGGLRYVMYLHCFRQY